MLKGRRLRTSKISLDTFKKVPKLIATNEVALDSLARERQGAGDQSCPWCSNSRALCVGFGIEWYS